jgi:HEAT repeat protein
VWLALTRAPARRIHGAGVGPVGPIAAGVDRPMVRDEIDMVIAAAMVGIDEECEPPGSQPPTGRDAIRSLHDLGSREVLDASLAACRDADPLRRRVGAAVLGQLGHAEVGFTPVFVAERFRGLADLLAAEIAGPNDPDVLSEVCIALGHLGDPGAVPLLLRVLDHPDADIRFGVAFALGGQETPEAVDGLIALSRDADDDVRDWATFGLGGLTTADGPALRAALQARLDDGNHIIRFEAIEGLAVRGDRSVIPALIRALEQDVSLPLLDAADELATPDMGDALAAAAAGGLVIEASYGPYDLTKVWREAMHRCGCDEAAAQPPPDTPDQEG